MKSSNNHAYVANMPHILCLYSLFHSIVSLHADTQIVFSHGDKVKVRSIRESFWCHCVVWPLWHGIMTDLVNLKSYTRRATATYESKPPFPFLE